MALARRTGKTLPELQKFLQAHPVCFTDSGQTKYKLNPSPPIHGLWKVHSFIWRYSTQKATETNTQVDSNIGGYLCGFHSACWLCLSGQHPARWNGGQCGSSGQP